MKRAVAVAFVVLLAASLPAGVALGAGSVADRPSDPAQPGIDAASSQSTADPAGDVSADAAGDSSSDVLHRTTTLRQLPETGAFETEMTFDVPDAVASFEIELEAGATVEATDGFEPASGDGYAWTEDTDEPTIRFTMPADREGDGHASEGWSSGYTFADAGDWALVQVPAVSVTREQTEPVGVAETVEVDGPGAAGTDVAFLGEVTEYDRTADGERIRLAVPEAATLEESPDAILDTLEAASERLDVGASRDEVFFVAAPTDADWAARGIQYGQTDAWVSADAALDEPSNVWLHEYVHVRQAFANPDVGTASDARWLVEAQAEYYAATLALEQGLVDFDEFATFLERGERSPYADGTLAEPDSWEHDDTDYVKGPLVYGEIDRQLRLATDGDRTLEDAVRLLNAREEAVTGADVREILEVIGDETVRETADRYALTDRTPAMWSHADHETAFDQPVAAIDVGLGSEPITVDGESWADRVGEGDDPTVAVPVDAPITVSALAENVGDRDGTGDATLQVDGAIVDHESTFLEAGADARTELTWTPAEPGAYDVQVGDDRLTVLVRSSASLTVTELTTDPESVDVGEETTATATVAAAGDSPGAGVLTFQTPAGTVAERPVAVEPGETTTVSATLTFENEGHNEVTVGERTTTVTVGGGLLSAAESMPGFGAVAVVAALAATVAALARRP